jgi:hypothetical protein
MAEYLSKQEKEEVNATLKVFFDELAEAGENVKLNLEWNKIDLVNEYEHKYWESIYYSKKNECYDISMRSKGKKNKDGKWEKSDAEMTKPQIKAMMQRKNEIADRINTLNLSVRIGNKPNPEERALMEELKEEQEKENYNAPLTLDELDDLANM